jgi:uncharacterized membrane protein
MFVVLALAIGIVAGLRAMTAPAAVSWAAYLGMLAVAGSPVAFLARPWTPWILTVLALVELVSDQLPKTPPRTVPVQFGTRILAGALSGAAIGASAGSWSVGALAGAFGAIVGTFGGKAARARLAASFGRDLPAALIEDAVAIGAAALIVVLA